MRSPKTRVIVALAGMWVLVFIVPSLPPAAIAEATHPWRSTGPFGGWVDALVRDPVTPTTMYAGTDHGVFKSMDGGGTWQQGNLDPAQVVQAMAIDPSNPTVIFAGGFGVFRSVDSGLTWTAYGLGRKIVTGLAVDPSDPSRVFVGTLGALFRTEDAGATWQKVLAVPSYSIVFDPTAPSVVYVGTCKSGVAKSSDSGDSWSLVNEGLKTPCPITLTMDKDDPQTLYAAGNGVYRTIDGGQTWISLGLARVYVTDVEPIPAAGLVYASTYGKGVLRTSDDGATWEPLRNGLPDKFAMSLSADPSGSPITAGLSGSGVYQSTDGTSWHPSTTGMTSLNIYSLAFDPLQASTLYAGTLWSYTGLPAGVFKSSDGGATWMSVDSGFSSTAVISLAVDPTTEGTVYAGTNGGGMYKSVDGAATWARVDQGIPELNSVISMAHHPRRAGVIFAASNSEGVFASMDGGEDWVSRNKGLSSTYVSRLVMAPSSPQTLYVGTDGVYRTMDAGAHWTHVSNGLPLAYVPALAVDPVDSLVVYAGGAAVYKTTDGGENWTPAGALPVATVSALAVDPKDPQTVYAGTSEGVFFSLDGAATWTKIDPSGLRVAFIQELLLHPSGKLFAGTYGQSVVVVDVPA